MEIPHARNFWLCSQYQPVSAFGFACEKFLIFRLTCFATLSGFADGVELLQREAIRAKPRRSERGQEAPAVDRSTARMILTARSEPYNQGGPHARSVTDEAESFDER